jgi:hypothetical protein
MDRTADSLHLTALQELGSYLKACDVSGVACRRIIGIPVSRNLRRVFLDQHRIKDGLMWQTRREVPIAAFLDKRQLLWANGAKQ